MALHDSKSYSFIDLFAGAGGLSEGFITSGFRSIANIEMDRHACFTLKTRSAFHYLKQENRLNVYYAYLSGKIPREDLYSFVPNNELNRTINKTMSPAEMEYLFDQVDNRIFSSGRRTIDVIIGGPPCQAYSVIGRARTSNKMRGDPRNYLYKLYAEFLSKYKPKMFIFENVPGLSTADDGRYFRDMKEVFRDTGYHLESRLLNAKDFGVLQNRLRIILVGWKIGSALSYPEFEEVRTQATVKDLLSDLPRLQAGETGNRYRPGRYSSYLREYGIRTKDDVLTWHNARVHNKRDRSIYRLAIERWQDDSSRLMYTDVPTELQTHQNKSAFLDRYKVVASNLPVSHTLVAHIAKDGHHFIHPDLNQARSLTVRESARIQSFPDNYFFEGSRTSAFTQVGNAVPPLMAAGLAKGILTELQKEDQSGS